MSVENTIFRGLASKDCENTTTELLANLMKYKCMRDIFMKCISKSLPHDSQEEIPDINKVSINTQVVFPESTSRKKSVPDIILESDSCFLIIENKVKKTTKLQRTQIEDYTKLFKGKKCKFQKYIFLLPDGYDKNEIKSIDKDKYVSVNWSDIISAFYESDITKISPVVNEALTYLKSVIEIEDTTKITDKQPLYKIALEYDIEKLKKEKSLIEAVEKKIFDCKERIIKESKGKFIPSDDTSKNVYQFGSQIGIKKTKGGNSYSIWIGCSPCYFSDDDKKRFSIQLAINHDVVDLEKLKDTEFYDFHDGWYYFDFKDQDEGNIVSESMDLLQKYHKYMNEG